ncbi:MAG: hypothetical protein LQ352_001472, partial [Teloschistes flavicans]
MSPQPQAYRHPSPLATLTPHLIPLLPNSLPLLRRIQFQPADSTEPSPFPNAHVFATFPPSTPSPPPPARSDVAPPSASAAAPPLDLKNPTSPPFEFAAAWVDRSRAPETECWIFSTYEVWDGHGNFQAFARAEETAEGGKGGGGAAAEKINYSLRSTPRAEEARRHLLAVLNAIACHGGPAADDEGKDEEQGKEKKKKSNDDILVI